MADAIVRDAARTEADLAAMFGDAAPVTMTDVAAMAHATYAVEASQRVLQKMRELVFAAQEAGKRQVKGSIVAELRAIAPSWEGSAISFLSQRLLTIGASVVGLRDAPFKPISEKEWCKLANSGTPRDRARMRATLRQLFVLPVIQGDYAVTGTQYHTLKQLFAR